MTDHQSTHGHDCWGWGPKHYECAVREIERLAAQLTAAQQQGQTVAWRATSEGLRTFVSDATFRRFSPEIQRFYEPYKCESCRTAPPSAPAGVDFAAVASILRRAMRDGVHYGYRRGFILQQALALEALSQQPAAVDAALAQRIQALVGGVEVDLEAPLSAGANATTQTHGAMLRQLEPQLQEQLAESEHAAAAQAAEIEALRAEVEAWRELSDHVHAGACKAIWPDRYVDERIRDVAAALKRAERLAEALREVMLWIENWSPPFTEDDEWLDTEAKAQAALHPTAAQENDDA